MKQDDGNVFDGRITINGFQGIAREADLKTAVEQYNAANSLNLYLGDKRELHNSMQRFDDIPLCLLPDLTKNPLNWEITTQREATKLEKALGCPQEEKQ